KYLFLAYVCQYVVNDLRLISKVDKYPFDKSHSIFAVFLLQGFLHSDIQWRNASYEKKVVYQDIGESQGDSVLNRGKGFEGKANETIVVLHVNDFLFPLVAQDKKKYVDEQNAE